MIKIICISEIIIVPSFITAGLITHDLIYEMVYLYAKLFLELLIHRLKIASAQCIYCRRTKERVFRCDDGETERQIAIQRTTERGGRDRERDRE